MGLKDFISSLFGRGGGDKAGGAGPTGLSPTAMAGLSRTHAVTPPPRPRDHEPVIRLTPRAAAEVKKIRAEQRMQGPQTYLRVGVDFQPGGGFLYKLDISEDAGEADDFVFSSEGLRVRVDARSAPYLVGTTIDFKIDGAGKGFVFRNPNAQKVDD